MFNPLTKRTFIRHSFRYLSDTEPVSTSYVAVAYPFPDSEELTGPISEKSVISSNLIAHEPVEDGLGYPTSSPNYTYVRLPISCTSANIRCVFPSWKYFLRALGRY